MSSRTDAIIQGEYYTTFPHTEHVTLWNHQEACMEPAEYVMTATICRVIQEGKSLPDVSGDTLLTLYKESSEFPPMVRKTVEEELVRRLSGQV